MLTRPSRLRSGNRRCSANADTLPARSRRTLRLVPRPRLDASTAPAWSRRWRGCCGSGIVAPVWPSSLKHSSGKPRYLRRPASRKQEPDASRNPRTASPAPALHLLHIQNLLLHHRPIVPPFIGPSLKGTRLHPSYRHSTRNGDDEHVSGVAFAVREVVYPFWAPIHSGNHMTDRISWFPIAAAKPLRRKKRACSTRAREARFVPNFFRA